MIAHPTQAEHDGIVTLTPDAARDASANTDLWNDDLRPCTPGEHSWRASRFASLWIGMCLCIPTYSLAGGMIDLGMSWWEAVLTILVGSAVVLVPILLVAHAGTRYGIPYPVFARLWFGTRGAHLPALARADHRRGLVRHQRLVRRARARRDRRPARARMGRLRRARRGRVRRVLDPQRRDRDARAAGDRAARRDRRADAGARGASRCSPGV